MKKIIITVFMMMATLLQVGCEKEPYSATNILLDTVCSITIYEGEIDGKTLSQNEVATIGEESFDVIKYYQIMLTKEKTNIGEMIHSLGLNEGAYVIKNNSSFYTYSEFRELEEKVFSTDIINVNDNKGDLVRIGEETYEILKYSKELSEKTNGLFDITTGDLTNLWNFSNNPNKPSNEDIDKIIPFISFENLNLEKKERLEGEDVEHDYFALLEEGSSEIDLGGIAKGYIADRISDFLIQQGVTEAIVNLGGNTVAIGYKNGNEPWKIGVETSRFDAKEMIGYLNLNNQTAVTSGVYERYFEENGVRYHHVLDPHTGYPVDTDLVSVTVIGELGMSYMADGLSTSCLLLGKEKAKELMKDYPEFQYIFVDENGNIINETEEGVFEYIQ